jgi:hypothetical protein
MPTYAITSGNDKGLTIVSDSLRGAKCYATRHGYDTIYHVCPNTWAGCEVAFKEQGKWVGKYGRMQWHDQFDNGRSPDEIMLFSDDADDSMKLLETCLQECHSKKYPEFFFNASSIDAVLVRADATEHDQKRARVLARLLGVHVIVWRKGNSLLAWQ